MVANASVCTMVPLADSTSATTGSVLNSVTSANAAAMPLSDSSCCTSGLRAATDVTAAAAAEACEAPRLDMLRGAG